ncbi:MAG: 6-bladed beta-propeller [Cyclobacteriaceae bacterium]|nr:6-bladed beta-propeller [Cyclobacteriaceae bacterium]
MVGTFFLCCTSSGWESDVNVYEEFIDISNIPKQEQLISIRDLLSEVEYIKLKETDSFYLSSAQKILEFNNKILVLDRHKKELVAYSLTGTYLGKVGKKGSGPKEYLEVTDFDINYLSNRIVIFSRPDQAIIEFDSTLKHIKKMRIGKWGYQISVLKSGNFALYLGYDDENGHILHIYDTSGILVRKTMQYPLGKELVPMDYTGFVVGNFYSYPLSSSIYYYNEFINEKRIKVNIPDGRSEDLIFDHADFLNPKKWMSQHILSRFMIGKKEKEILFYYSFKEGSEYGFTLGLKLLSGQIFGHFNLRHGSGKKSDAFTKMFFIGPYNLPTYSLSCDCYYVATDVEHFTDYISSDKDAALKEIKEIDLVLHRTLTENMKSFETPIVMRFKLKEQYDQKS